MRIVYLRQAVSDQRREAAFWKEARPDLKERFLAELSASVETIGKAPEAYAKAPKGKGLRRFVERRFGTAILYSYSKREDLLMVVRIYNCRMDPKRFQP